MHAWWDPTFTNVYVSIARIRHLHLRDLRVTAAGVSRTRGQKVALHPLPYVERCPANPFHMWKVALHPLPYMEKCPATPFHMQKVALHPLPYVESRPAPLPCVERRTAPPPYMESRAAPPSPLLQDHAQIRVPALTAYNSLLAAYH